jgi:4-hydroxyacetophenone monooxygenase
MTDGRVREQFTCNIRHRRLAPSEVRENLEPVPTLYLLLVAVHVTGDVGLLDRFEDRVAAVPAGAGNAINLWDEAEAQVEDPAARAELVDLLARELGRDEHPGYASFVDRPDVFLRMSTLLAGDAAKPQHLEMNIEMAGFAPDTPVIAPTKTPPPTLNLAIIGGGMTGVDAAVKAIDRGIDCTIFEKEASLGGVWWTQRYPGVAVDTSSICYSLSWNLTPSWTRLFPLGDEFRAYLHATADRFDLWQRCRFNSEITQLEWLEDEQVWELTVRSTVDRTIETVRAAAVLAGTGHLCRPKYVNVPGRESFAGASAHTARWDPELDLSGKRVAVVGVGASGVQVVAEVESLVEHLYVFQRQPAWILPNAIGSGELDERERWGRRHLPYYMQWLRLHAFANLNDMCWKFNAVDREWMKSHTTSVSEVNEFLRQRGLAYINDAFADRPDLAAKLTPDFMFGAKREVRDPADFGPGSYYWTLRQPHVSLVDTPISRIVPDGVVTADGETVALDAIIWATGLTIEFLSEVVVIGRGGRRLMAEWAGENARTYLGGTVPGFPNLFIQDGPNTGIGLGGSGHNFLTETVNHYLIECLQFLIENDASSMEVTSEAHRAFNERIDELMEELVWAVDKSANTYFRNAAGRVWYQNPFELSDYWRMNRRPDPKAFKLRARRLEHDTLPLG